MSEIDEARADDGTQGIAWRMVTSHVAVWFLSLAFAGALHRAYRWPWGLSLSMVLSAIWSWLLLILFAYRPGARVTRGWIACFAAALFATLCLAFDPLITRSTFPSHVTIGAFVALAVSWWCLAKWRR